MREEKKSPITLPFVSSDTLKRILAGGVCNSKENVFNCDEVLQMANELMAFRVIAASVDVEMDGVKCPKSAAASLMALRQLVEKGRNAE